MSEVMRSSLMDNREIDNVRIKRLESIPVGVCL